MEKNDYNDNNGYNENDNKDYNDNDGYNENDNKDHNNNEGYSENKGNDENLDNEFASQVERQFISFIMKTVQGLKLDYLKRQKKLEAEFPTDQPEAYLRDVDANYNCELAALENDDIEEALNTLTQKQRKIIELVIINDLTEKSVAEELNISQQGVHQTKKRALSLLEKYLLEAKL